MIDQIQAQYNSLLKEKNISFNKSVEWNGMVNWDRNQIQQVIMNLMQNSIDAITEAGEITFKIKEFNNRINIKIRDNGSGIPEHIQNKIFNLYYTTKASGTGIGLSIIQRIIFEHNGTLEFESEENIGTTFIIRLPINSANNL